MKKFGPIKPDILTKSFQYDKYNEKFTFLIENTNHKYLIISIGTLNLNTSK